MSGRSDSIPPNQVEDRLLQDILNPLQVFGERGTNWGCNVSLIVAPIIFSILYFSVDLGLLKTIGMAIGFAFALGVVIIGLAGSFETKKVENARIQFNRMFPIGSENREVALRCLAHHQSDQAIIMKLKEAFGVGDDAPGPVSAPETKISDFLEGLEAPEHPPAPPALPVVRTSEPEAPSSPDKSKVKKAAKRKRIYLDLDEVDWEASPKKGSSMMEPDQPTAAKKPAKPVKPAKNTRT